MERKETYVGIDVAKAGMDIAVCPRTSFEFSISPSGCRSAVLIEADTQLVHCHGYMLVLVSVYTDDDLNGTTAYMAYGTCHFYLLEYEKWAE